MSLVESFGRSRFARFINSSSGRSARVVAGFALIAWAYMSLGGTTGIILMAVGLVPLATGTLNLCLISALLGGPISAPRADNR
jgi:hypothetical protein